MALPETLFCGKMYADGAANFTDLVRADYKTGVCPEGTKKCSDATDADTTICIDVSKDLSECPITTLLTVPANQTDTYRQDPSYTVVEAPVQG